MAIDPRDACDWWAAQYDTGVNDTPDLNAEVRRKQDVIESNNDVLESGCGTGLNTEWLAAQAGHVVATAVLDEMLAQPRERIDPGSVTLQHLDVTESWPFETGRFDTVVATLMLEHGDDLALVLREARRVVRDGGTFFFTELRPYRQREGTQAYFQEESTGETAVLDVLTHPDVGVRQYRVSRPALPCRR